MGDAAATAPWFGRAVGRKEDVPLVTGHGRYVADIRLPGTLDVAFVRSPVAHASIRAIDTSAAWRSPGVVAVVTADTINDAVAPFTRFVDQERTPPDLEAAVRPEILPCPIEVLAGDRVRYVGEAVAAVVADTRYCAEDAAELVDVDYEELPVVTDPEAARRPDAPSIHDSVPGNVQARFEVEVGDVAGAFAAAAHTLRLRFRTQRLSGSPMETRGVLASYSDVTDELCVWSSTQVPYMVRTRIAEQLGLAEHEVRVVAPHVGGGFGPKVQVYPEEVLVAHLARVLCRPVRWIEDRREHLLSTAHARDQVHDLEVAFGDDGVIAAIKDRFLLDCGAYNPFSITCAYNTAAHFRGVYRVPGFSISGECVLTNKTFNVPYRGAGRPEAAFAMDRVINTVASHLGLDPAEVIRRNLIPPAEMPCPRGMPYRDGHEIVYDAGDFPAGFDRLLELVDYPGHRREQRSLRERGVWRGIGFGTYVEGTGIGPFESAVVRLDSRGRLVVHAGCAPHGQSHDTTISQVVADEFGVRPGDIVFRAGDTSLVPYGSGTFASRTAVTAGSAALTSARRLKARITRIAGELLEISPDDLEVADGYVRVRGAPEQRVGFRDIFVAASPGPAACLPADAEPGASDSYYFVPPTVTWAFGVVAAVVDVDVETGMVIPRKLAIIHDCGRLINPVVVEGQIHGGLAQGLGAALYESIVHDDQGQPLTTTLMDYLLPTAAEVPEFVGVHLETSSERNPLGVKGVGEAGAIAPPGAIANAVADALSPLRVELDELPLSPPAVLAAVQAARDRAQPPDSKEE
ncbi:MAG: molybdopterin-dependent oxidoreductase [Streptosporangiales bacterium]|nr:molybdopterin-dependent oxidoreductase [Streptosporangiales bacterium]